MNKYLPFLMIASLAACGGGSSGGDETSPTTPTTPVETPTDTTGNDTAGGGDTGGDTTGGDTSGGDVVEPDPSLEDGESNIRPALVVETSGGRYELTNDTAGFIAGETAYRINVARGPNRPNGGGFGTALGYEGADVTVYAGTDTGAQPNFAAIDGDTSAAPTGNATFAGHYSVADDPAEGFNALATEDENGALTLNFDLAASTLTGTSDNGVLSVNATVTGAELGGTVTVDGQSADIDVGGFYGTNEVAGGFTNTAYGGYFYGQQ